MKLRHTMLALVLCLSLLAPLSSTVTAAPPVPVASGINVPVVGTVVGGTLNAVFNLTSFALRNGQIFALGTLTGTLTNAAGVVTSFATNIALPVTIGRSTCEILHLELGPIDLNLLGLMVHLDKIVLDITAQSGPGNLLGNLLCAIAGLLDSGGALSQVVNLLNQILAQL